MNRGLAGRIPYEGEPSPVRRGGLSCRILVRLGFPDDASAGHTRGCRFILLDDTQKRP